MSEEDERTQFNKLRFKWPDNRKFRQTRKELLAENPKLMSGIPREMKYEPTKKVERSKWEELRKTNPPKNNGSKKGYALIIIAGIIGLIIYYLYYVQA